MRFEPRVCWVLLGGVLLLGACRHVPSEKELQGAQIHYDLGVQLQQSDAQGAYREFEAALALNPDFPEALQAKAVLLHLAFNRPDEAVTLYRKALAIRPTFTEAKTNLANVYLDQARYDEAIALYEQALNDMLYATPFIAHGNLGWALYRKGEVDRAIDHIKAALTTNPKFCLGNRNLGTIYEERGDLGEACRQFSKYRESCPEAADAHFREGLCLTKSGDAPRAKLAFQSCVAKAQSETLKDDCQRMAEKLGP